LDAFVQRSDLFGQDVHRWVPVPFGSGSKRA
jgi:hypothetical protein